MCGCCCRKEKEEDKVDLASPIKNRGCTDIIFLIIFIAFWAGMIFIAAFGIKNGDAFRLVYGYDSFGNTCDQDNTDRAIGNISLSGQNMKGRPYVFFMDVSHPFGSLSICVNRCPDQELPDMQHVQTFSMQTGSMLCQYNVDLANYTKVKSGLKGPCPVTPIHKSQKPLLFHCLPSDLTSVAVETANDLIGFLNMKDTFHKVLSDFVNAWKEMILLCLLSLGFAGLMVLFIRFLASVIVWVILAVAIVASIVGTGFLWWSYADTKNKLDHDDATKIPLLDVEINSERAFLVYSIIATILTIILLLVILVLRKRIALVVALFYEAGRCITSTPCLLLQPVWTFFVLIVFFMYWAIVLAYLSTAETPSQNLDGFVKYTEHQTVSYMWWYHLIGLIWTSEFIIACEQLAISGAVATWYFSRAQVMSCPIGHSIRKLILYHLGSVAFGSFVITLVKLPRMILMYLQTKLKGSENKCASFCMKCCMCCLWCLEKCLKYLNQNAYTIVAIQGTNFCTSAHKAFTVLVGNALRVAAINSVGDFILFLGKIGVMAATAAVGIIWLKSREDLHFYAIPVLLVCVFSYFIASCFLSTYEMVIDAMLLCFCHDCDINDGSAERPYYAHESLLKFVDNTSKQLDALSKRSGGAEESEVARV
ncbi:hypothetical protein CHS0354_010601 [Potamilus streckersoni]|uniref:Choline transporter-like protein n=1 Tax=Potamilus streckersoni TaxID=2493646 RepID=A0AAE0SGE0_9BIVA|nr:hypothetical protein CHS0354_010601 [Potamilus streckersoni]